MVVDSGNSGAVIIGSTPGPSGTATTQSKPNVVDEKGVVQNTINDNHNHGDNSDFKTTTTTTTGLQKIIHIPEVAAADPLLSAVHAESGSVVHFKFLDIGGKLHSIRIDAGDVTAYSDVSGPARVDLAKRFGIPLKDVEQAGLQWSKEERAFVLNSPSPALAASKPSSSDANNNKNICDLDADFSLDDESDNLMSKEEFELLGIGAGGASAGLLEGDLEDDSDYHFSLRVNDGEPSLKKRKLVGEDGSGRKEVSAEPIVNSNAHASGSSGSGSINKEATVNGKAANDKNTDQEKTADLDAKTTQEADSEPAAHFISISVLQQKIAQYLNAPTQLVAVIEERSENISEPIQLTHGAPNLEDLIEYHPSWVLQVDDDDNDDWSYVLRDHRPDDEPADHGYPDGDPETPAGCWRVDKDSKSISVSELSYEYRSDPLRILSNRAGLRRPKNPDVYVPVVKSDVFKGSSVASGAPITYRVAIMATEWRADNCGTAGLTKQELRDCDGKFGVDLGDLSLQEISDCGRDFCLAFCHTKQYSSASWRGGLDEVGFVKSIEKQEEEEEQERERTRKTRRTTWREDKEHLDLTTLAECFFETLTRDDALELAKAGLLRDLKATSEECRGDKAIVLGAVRSRGCSLACASAELRDDREVVEVAVNHTYHALGDASSRLRADRDLVCMAVRNHGCALEYASEDLRRDRKIVEMALGSKGSAIQFASAQFRDDEELVTMASRSTEALKYASDRLRNNEKFILDLIERHGGRVLEHAKKELLVSKKVVLSALRDDLSATEFLTMYGAEWRYSNSISFDGIDLGYSYCPDDVASDKDVKAITDLWNHMNEWDRRKYEEHGGFFYPDFKFGDLYPDVFDSDDWDGSRSDEEHEEAYARDVLSGAWCRDF